MVTAVSRSVENTWTAASKAASIFLEQGSLPLPTASYVEIRHPETSHPANFILMTPAATRLETTHPGPGAKADRAIDSILKAENLARRPPGASRQWRICLQPINL
jgi:hypothetical protein